MAPPQAEHAIDMNGAIDSKAGAVPGTADHGHSVVVPQGLVKCEAASTVAGLNATEIGSKWSAVKPKGGHSTLHSVPIGNTEFSQPLPPPLGAASDPTAAVKRAPDTEVKGGNWFVRTGRRIKESFQTYGANVRKRPFIMLGPPFLLFGICVALGVYGVIAGAQKEADDKRTVVTGAALDWASSFKLSLENTFTPLVTLSIFIRQNTNFPSFAPRFPSIADDVLAQLPARAIQELQISPMGVISIIYPNNTNSTGRQGADIFVEPALRGGALMTLRQKSMMLNGPLFLINGGNFAAIVRLPIYIPNSTFNETFGTNRNLPTNCPDGLCWNPLTQEKFWGFVTAIVPLDALRSGVDSRLDLLKQKGYLWRFTRPYTSTELNPKNETEYTFANSTTWPTDPVSVPLNVSNAVWTIYLEPKEGWTPSWKNGMIILVCLGSFVLALLVAVIMASWVEQKRLLGEVMDSNAALAATTRHLEEEKLRLDALLVRQYNLLSVLGGHGGKGLADGDHQSGSDTNSKEGITLERIELMRRQLAVNTNSSTADIESIQTLEMLGEGTFGKVYKGLWRGTVVAVKTMVLPSNMSGAEKREKMAVMEAAISSSLSHPNIVQTYTYAIRPVKESDASVSDGSLLIGGVGDSMNVQNSMIKSSASGVGGRQSSASSGSAVHSYEVRLVLEFCDKGCLRDALDDGAFMGPVGLNYRAVLDIAADVAKAMLHLHSLNVLHADLKARNVMLKSEGNQGVIAKVADFGLSLKMDHLETHISAVYQGTMTHMAPEIMLEGRVSKAADVYAFGITMWELFTGGHAFQGVPRALLGHQITKECLRPRFPDITPSAFRSLAERCWHPLVDMRPDFKEVLDELLKLRSSESGDTPPLVITPHVHKQPNGSGPALPAAAGFSPNAPALGGEGTDQEWAAGKTLSGATVIRQRPVTLPKIHEGSEPTVNEGSEPATNGEVANSKPAAASQPATGNHALTGPGLEGHGAGKPGAGANKPSNDSLPSGMQLTDASQVGDSTWR